MEDGGHTLTYINYERINEWIVGIAIVEFDVDLGQVVRHLYPEDCLNSSEQKAISHMSFPDSNSFTKAEGSSQYIFRVKRQTKDVDNRFCFGFTYFQQKKDTNINRGYKQQSVVLLTTYPFIQFFNQISEIIGKHAFNNPDNLEVIIKINKWEFMIIDLYVFHQNYTNLQQICKIQYKFYIKSKPQLISLNGSNLKIINIPHHVKIERKNQGTKKFLCSRLSGEGVKNSQNSPLEQMEYRSNDASADIKYYENDSDSSCQKSPDKSSKVKSFQDLNILQVETKTNGMQSMLSQHDCQEKGFFQEFNIYNIAKKNKIHNLWKVWEIVLTNQPLLIAADSPEECSGLVFGAISLISPLEYIGDYRPYFTIYDLEYKIIKDECDRKMTKNVIIGITNPFLLKTLSDFPVILRFDSDYSKNNQDSSKKSTEKIFPFECIYNKDLDQIYDLFINSVIVIIYIEQEYLILFQQDKLKELENLYKMLLPIDNVETDAINNSLIRKSFRTLTQQFIQTFEDYFQNQKNVSKLNKKHLCTDIKIFDQKEFIKNLEYKKFPFQDLFEKKEKIISLYEKFLRSANFLNYIKEKKNIYFTKTPLNV